MYKRLNEKVWWHSKFEERYKFYWRLWFHFYEREIDLDLLLFSKDFALSVGRGSRSLKFHIAVPYIFSFWFKLGGVLKFGKPREVSIRTHSKAIWWTIWRDHMDGWSRSVPKWREGSFHIDDFLLGKSKCNTTVIEERDVVIPMPEKSYTAKAKLMLYEWKRPRWFTKTLKRVEIEVPEGIPHEGKGENSWDCGVDRTYGITTGECHSIAKGVGVLVGSVLSDRVKYGGWSDWKWSK